MSCCNFGWQCSTEPLYKLPLLTSDPHTLKQNKTRTHIRHAALRLAPRPPLLLPGLHPRVPVAGGILEVVPPEPRILLVLVAAAQLSRRLHAVAGLGHAERRPQGRAVAGQGSGSDVLFPVDALLVRGADAEVFGAADTGLAGHLDRSKRHFQMKLLHKILSNNNTNNKIRLSIAFFLIGK